MSRLKSFPEEPTQDLSHDPFDGPGFNIAGPQIWTVAGDDAQLVLAHQAC